MKKMTEEEMLTMVIRKRGFEHKDTIWFANWLEKNPTATYGIKVEHMEAALDDFFDEEED